MSLCLQDTVQKGKLTSYPRLTQRVCLLCGAENKGQPFQCPEQRQVSSRSSSMQKEIPPDILKALERIQSKDRTLGVCAQWASQGQCSRGDSCSFKHDSDKKRGKVENHVHFPMKRKEIRKETENVIPKGRGPTVIPEGKVKEASMLPFFSKKEKKRKEKKRKEKKRKEKKRKEKKRKEKKRKEKKKEKKRKGSRAQQNPHVILDTHPNAPTTNPKVVARKGSVHIHGHRQSRG